MNENNRSNTTPDMDLFIDTCRENNLKLTPQRMTLFLELSGSRDHPSTGSLYRRAREIFPNISFDTVNRTLLTFLKLGIIRIVEGYGSPRRFDPNLAPHHHFRCVDCDGIIDIYDKGYDDLEIAGDVKEKCVVLHKRVVLEGICDCCQGKKRTGNE